jgi:hypothetical protein
MLNSTTRNSYFSSMGTSYATPPTPTSTITSISSSEQSQIITKSPSSLLDPENDTIISAKERISAKKVLYSPVGNKKGTIATPSTTTPSFVDDTHSTQNNNNSLSTPVYHSSNVLFSSFNSLNLSLPNIADLSEDNLELSEQDLRVIYKLQFIKILKHFISFH